MKAIVVTAIALLVLVILSSWAFRSTEGRHAVHTSDAARARGDLVDAIVYARAAAESRCPACSAPAQGYQRLQLIAKEAEAKNDPALALAAWRAVRAAVLGTLTLASSPPLREQADAEIARLEHRIEATAVAGGASPSPAANEERLRAALAASTVPSGTVFVILTIGGAVFLYGAFRFVKERFKTAELITALAGGALALVGVLLF